MHKSYPFTIRIKDRTDGEAQSVRIKIDPGNKKTGIAVVREGTGNKPVKVLCLFELEHRGRQISEALTARRAFRRRRRGANLRYRAPGFNNRGGDRSGWLAPSLQHRVDTTMSWVNRLRKICPITGAAVERVRFDMQILENPEISGIGYQQGTLAGYEVREYVLQRDGNHCSYCGTADVPLNLDHVIPRSRGGSNRPSNLVPPVYPLQRKEGSTPVEEFAKPEVRSRIKKQLKAPLKDAAAVNATRWALREALQDTGLPIEVSSGGRTKFNRSRLGIPKTHALDATCVGEVEAVADGWQTARTQTIKATGRGTYCRTNVAANGFPRGYYTRTKIVHGFKTGDMVRAEVPQGKRAGVHIGRVAVRATGSFRVGKSDGNRKHCNLIHRADGYGLRPAALPSPPEEGRHPRGCLR